MRHGPVLTASLWDPARPAQLESRLREAAGGSALPLSTAAGDAAGCHHLHVWAGDLGLGLPEDPPSAWAEVGVGLGRLVLAARPLLALVAVEWAAEGLLDPDPELLRPGLTCGWVRALGLTAARRDRFERLVARGTARPLGDGLTWAARGAVALDGRTAGEPAEVADQVWWAWTGTSATRSATLARLVLGVPGGVGEGDLTAALPAGYEALGVAGGLAVARPPEWVADVGAMTADLVEAATLLDARWGLVEAVSRGGRAPAAFWVPAGSGLTDEIVGLLPGADLASSACGTVLTTGDGSGVEAARVLRRAAGSAEGSAEGSPGQRASRP